MVATLPIPCPVCASTGGRRLFTLKGHPVWECGRCRLAFQHPQPSDETLAAIYTQDYHLDVGSPESMARFSRMKRATAVLYLDELGGPEAVGGKRLLEVGCGFGDFLCEARSRGFEVCGVEPSASSAVRARKAVGEDRVLCGSIEEAHLPKRSFDVGVLIDVIEHVRDPVAFLDRLRSLLKPGGTLLIVTPTRDSVSAKILRSRWMEYKVEHLFAFNRGSLSRLLGRTGFAQVSVRPGRKVLSLRYVALHFERFPVPLLTPVFKAVQHILPADLLDLNLVLPGGGMLALARAG